MRLAKINPPVVLLLICAALPVFVAAQDLGAIARAQKAQREKQQNKSPSRVLTNEDLYGQGPQAYSYTAYELEEGAAAPKTINVSRDGSRVAVEMIVPASAGLHNEGRTFKLYDLETQQVYSKASRDSTACSVMRYNSPALPASDDPIGAGADAFEKWAGTVGDVRELTLEVVNGISAKVVEVSSTKGKRRIWVAQNGGYLLKVVSVPLGALEKTVFEIRHISLEKPPASELVPPTACVAARGGVTAVKKAREQ